MKHNYYHNKPIIDISFPVSLLSLTPLPHTAPPFVCSAAKIITFFKRTVKNPLFLCIFFYGWHLWKYKYLKTELYFFLFSEIGNVCRNEIGILLCHQIWCRTHGGCLLKDHRSYSFSFFFGIFLYLFMQWIKFIVYCGFSLFLLNSQCI